MFAAVSQFGLIQPLKNAVFRRLFTAQAVSLIGTGLTTVALGLLAYELQPSSAGQVLGIALAAKMVAYLMVAPASAAGFGWLSRLGKFKVKHWLVGINLARAACVFGLFFTSEVWQLIVVIFMLNSLAASYTPLYQALLPSVLEDEESYTQSLALSQLAVEAETLLSPSFAALLLLAMAFESLFVLNAAAFVLMASVLLGVAIPKLDNNQRTGSLVKQLSFGVRSYLKTPRLRAVLALNLVLSCSGAMVIINTVVLVKQHLGLADSQVPLLLLAAGVGAIFASLFAQKLYATFTTRRVMLAASIFTVVALCAGAFLTRWALGLSSLFALWFLIGACNAFILIPTANVVRLSCAENDRNDFFAANFSLTHAMWLFSYLLAGVGGAKLGLTTVFLIAAVVAVFATLFAQKTWSANEIVEITHVHEPMVHSHFHHHNEVHHVHLHTLHHDQLHGQMSGHSHSFQHRPHHAHRLGGHNATQDVAKHEPQQMSENSQRSVHPNNDGCELGGGHHTTHSHERLIHTHRFVIDEHHPHWPKAPAQNESQPTAQHLGNECP